MSKCYYNVRVSYTDDLQPQNFTLITTQKGSNQITYACRNGVLTRYACNAHALKVAIYFHLAEKFIQEHQQQKAANPDADTVLNAIYNILDTEDAEYEADDDFGAAYWIAAGMEANDPKIMRKGLFRALVHYLDMQIVIEASSEAAATSDVLEYDPTDYAQKFDALCDKELYPVTLTLSSIDGDEIEYWEDHDLCLPAYLGEMLLNDESEFADNDSNFYDNLIDSLKVYIGKLLIRQHIGLKKVTTADDDDDVTPLEMFFEMAHENENIDDEEYEDVLKYITHDDNVSLIYEIVDEYELLQIECNGFRYGGDPADAWFTYED